MNKLIVLLAIVSAVGLAMGSPISAESDPSDLLEAESVDEPKSETFEYGFKPVSSVAASTGSEDDQAAKAAEENIKNIAYNSREIRLMGPNQKEVEMKDDVGTKLMIALDNLSKEAGDLWSQANEKLDKGWNSFSKDAGQVWGQVNERLDKGWTDFKQMVEGVVSQNGAKKSTANIIPY